MYVHARYDFIGKSFCVLLTQHCPPCRQMLPQLRKAATLLPDVNFGTVDCTIHNPLCNQNNVRSYPTTIMYNDSKPHMNTGYKTAEEIVDFIEVGNYCHQTMFV